MIQIYFSNAGFCENKFDGGESVGVNAAAMALLLLLSSVSGEFTGVDARTTSAGGGGGGGD